MGYKDKEKQREYQRELMKKRRAKGSNVGITADGKWDIPVDIPGELYETLERRAEEKGLAVQDYLRGCLEYIVKQGENRSSLDSVNTTDKLKGAGLVMKGNVIVGVERVEAEPKWVPLFNPAIHKPGDRVLIKPPYSKKLVEVIVQEVDAEGNAVPKW